MTSTRVDSSNVPTAPFPLDQALADLLAAGYQYMGQVAMHPAASGGYSLRHRDDAAQPIESLELFSRPEDAEEIARYDDAAAYRPLKTAPNLRHGWRLDLPDVPTLRLALECFYPGRLGAFLLWKKNRLPVTFLRDTLRRQTGMYRVTQKITDAQTVEMVGRFCRSDGGCARTILWHVGPEPESVPLATLPPGKFDPAIDQVFVGLRQEGTSPSGGCVPMFCQEICNLLVAEARAVVKGTKPAV